MSIESFPTALTPVVYALMCEDDSGSGFMKIGRSANFGARLKTLQTGCPLPIKKIAVINTGTSQKSEIVEKAFHSRLKDKVSQGEWFAFDFRCEKDKALFKSVTRDVFDKLLSNSRQKWWKIIDGEDDYLKACIESERFKSRSKSAKRIKDARSLYWDGARSERPSIVELLDRQTAK